MSTQEAKCWNCESDKEPYFSRIEPMGNYCQDCGKNSDEIDPIDHKEIKSQLAAERALSGRLADAIQNHFDVDEDVWATDDGLKDAVERLQLALAAWKEARGE